MKIIIMDAALDFLADVGFDPIYGARPLKRTIQRELETGVAKQILSGEFIDGDTILVDVTNERISLRKATDAEIFTFGTPTLPPQDGKESLSPSFE